MSANTVLYNDALYVDVLCTDAPDYLEKDRTRAETRRNRRRAIKYNLTHSHRNFDELTDRQKGKLGKTVVYGSSFKYFPTDRFWGTGLLFNYRPSTMKKLSSCVNDVEDNDVLDVTKKRKRLTALTDSPRTRKYVGWRNCNCNEYNRKTQ